MQQARARLGKGTTWEGHDFSRAVNPLTTSRASAPAVATVYFAYIGLLTIASPSLSLEVFGERRSVSRSPERFSGLWLFGTVPVCLYISEFQELPSGFNFALCNFQGS